LIDGECHPQVLTRPFERVKYPVRGIEAELAVSQVWRASFTGMAETRDAE
jgi:hypothetical protein